MTVPEFLDQATSPPILHHECPLCDGPRFRPLHDMQRVELVRCEECDAVFVPTIPTLAELSEHYEGYPRAAKFNSPVSQRARERLLDQFEQYRQTGKFLDVGCDIGFLLNQARKRGWETFGTEFSEEVAALCTANGHQMHAGALRDAPFEAGSFDVVIYTEVIEHIYNQREEFAQVWDLLRPGGMLYVTTPNFDSLSRRILGDRWSVIEYPEHLVYFTPSTLRAFIHDAGFEEVSIETTGISVNRLTAGLRASARPKVKPTMTPETSDPVRKVRPRPRKPSADEMLRSSMERNRLLGGLKKVINDLLDRSDLGDSIKATFRKPL